MCCKQEKIRDDLMTVQQWREKEQIEETRAGKGKINRISQESENKQRQEIIQ